MGALPQVLSRRPTGIRMFAEEVAPGTSARVSRLAPFALAAAGAALALLAISHGHDFATALARAAHASWALVAGGVAFEAASVTGYVVLFHRVVGRAAPRLRARDSYDITLAGTAATRLLPTAGLGGAAVAVWALRARGVRSREIASRMLGFLLILYSVYMGALVVFGGAVALSGSHVALGLAGVTLGAGIAAAAVVTLAAPAAVERTLERLAGRPGRVGSAAGRLASELPTLRASLAHAVGELRHPHPALLGALAWWGFDIGVLGAMLHAFGAAPALPALVLAYFLGTMFNLVPLPGTISGGLVGMLVALGTPAVPALAAVLAYRAIAVWGPAAWGVPSLGRLRATVTTWRHSVVTPT